MLKKAQLLILVFLLLIHPLANSNFYRHGETVALPLIGIRVNGGARFTNNKIIEVEIKSMKTEASLIESMKIGFEPNLNDANWQPYAESAQKIEIPGGEGEKRIYAQLKDKAGNTSQIESTQIIFDTTPPLNPAIQINGDEKFLNDKMGRVLVNLKAEGAHELMIANNNQFQNIKWESYKESVRWVIDAGSGDGEKTIYVKFRDQAGNETQPVFASIILDTTPPSDGKISINGGEKITRSRILHIEAESSDATKVRIVSRGEGKNYDILPENNGKIQIMWETDSIEGAKSIKAYFMDEAKNTTKIPAEATIMLKTRPPAPPVISINQNAKFTNHKDGIVNFSISTKENPQGLKILLSNKPNFEGATPRSFSTNVSNWQLGNETDGLKTIFARLIDEAGNISEVGKAEIMLDRTPPKINSFSINENSEWCALLKVTLTSDVDDAAEAKFTNNQATLRNIPWEKYNPVRADWTLVPGDGEKIVYAVFRDQAGNSSEIVSSKIKLDMTPPNGELIINGGNKFTNHPEGVIKIQIKCDNDVAGMQLSNLPDFSNIELTPLEKNIESWKIDNTTEGLKTVFLRLQDRAGNYSKVLTSSIILDRTPPAECDLVINNNDPYVRNPNKRVSLSLRAEGASVMMISNKQDFENAEWIPFKTAIAWTLEGPEGMHNVHAKFRDPAGNESTAISKSVRSDFSPPKIVKFSIDNDAEFSSDPQGLIQLTFDVEDAVEMVISNSQINDTSSISGKWTAYKPNVSWKLDGEDGLKIVYAVFRDDAQNMTQAHYDKIILDRIPPVDCKIAINNGATWFTNKDGKADIALFAKGAVSFMLSNSKDFTKSQWETMIDLRKDWQLNLSDQVANVYARFRDGADNISEPVEATIKIDLEPPMNASLTIDNGAKYVQNRDRKITFSPKADGATGMRIGQNPELRDAKWEPYATSKEFTFTEPDGEKVFYAQFSDDAGNQSEIVSSKIILDTTPPKINKFAINGGEQWTNANDKRVNIEIDATDATEMMISDNAEFSNAAWQPFRQNIPDYILPGEDGEKTIFIRLRDEPGNVSRIANAKINLKRSF